MENQQVHQEIEILKKEFFELKEWHKNKFKREKTLYEMQISSHRYKIGAFWISIIFSIVAIVISILAYLKTAT